jgi:hypothetical protein
MWTTRISTQGPHDLEEINSGKDASVRKSIAKVIKMSLVELFRAISWKFILVIYNLLKMSQGQSLPDPDLELINGKSLDFAKPKLFFKNIGWYVATSTYIQVPISSLIFRDIEI